MMFSKRAVERQGRLPASFFGKAQWSNAGDDLCRLLGSLAEDSQKLSGSIALAFAGVIAIHV